MSYNYSKRLIIFEGPDGAGKTTLARKLAEDIGAVYTHLGPFPRVKDGLARLYVEAMMPALLGHRDVVMDRCWISEVPYGIAFREGADRIGIRRRILERLAWRCSTTVVKCLPPWDVVRDGFVDRKGAEYLDNISQLQMVYDWYASNEISSLPTIYCDPLTDDVDSFVFWLQDELVTERSIAHMTNRQTSGNARAKVVIVGEGFGDTAEGDPLYQSPFASLVESGCSLWLARQLAEAGIQEKDLYWVNADQLTSGIIDVPVSVVALGVVAAQRLTELHCRRFEFVQHPQHWKRFRHRESYDLIPILKTIINQ
jgi:hypothetical protein